MGMRASVFGATWAVFMATASHAQDSGVQYPNIEARLASAFADESRPARPAAMTDKIRAQNAALIAVETPEEAAESDAAWDDSQKLKPVNGERCAAVDQEEVIKLVRLAAAEAGVDAGMAEAVAWAESSMGANQGPSSAGALGVMMLMPDTAAHMGVAERCDAEANIRGGIGYLKELQGEFGDPLLTLAAYNAGPGAVRSKMGIPDYPETTAYIAKVMNRWQLTQKVAQVTPSAAGAKRTGQVAQKEVSDEGNQWQDGHVLDFD